MREQTVYRYSRLQNEYQELSAHTEVLKQQAQLKYEECCNLQQYMNVNGSDKVSVARYKKALSDYNSLSNNISRNQGRLVNIANKINIECQKEQVRIERANMSAQRKMINAMNRAYMKSNKSNYGY